MHGDLIVLQLAALYEQTGVYERIISLATLTEDHAAWILKMVLEPEKAARIAPPHVSDRERSTRR